METTAEKIRFELNSIIVQLSDLIRELPIKKLDRSSRVVFVAPDYYFGEPSPFQRSIQLNLKNRYDKIAELLKLIFQNAPDDIKFKLEQTDNHFRIWLQLETNWSVYPDPEINIQNLKKRFNEFNPILDILDANKDSDKDIVIIPDTNSLLLSCDPLIYKKSINKDSFTILLLPTVLGELDKLKVLHRNPEVREKAQKVITRIKGWRTQGTLTSGVTTEKTITIKAIPNEPNMGKTLSWLDKDVADDRIITSVIEIQSKNPASIIVLYTSDINLQNKAEAAMIEYSELDI